MNAAARETVRAAKQLGFTYEGIDGRGHHALRHENGTPYRFPASGSDYRGPKNTLADLERIAGRKLPRPGRRRKSRKPIGGSGFSIELAARESRNRQRARDAAAARDRAAQRDAVQRERNAREIRALMQPSR